MIARPPVQVLVAGGEVGPFGRAPGLSLIELARPTIAAALADAGIQAEDIEAAFVGNAFGGLMQGQETMLGQLCSPTAALRPCRFTT